MSEFTQGHAVVIGVGADLPNTVIDAEGMAKILKDPERCAYPADQVKVLTREHATRDGILAALDQLAADVGPDGTALFYFSGHGYVVDMGIVKRYYLMPYGYDGGDLDSVAISDQEFMAKLKAIPAQKLLVLLDCCFASGLDNELNDKMAKSAFSVTFTKAPLPANAADELAKGSGRVVISSCKASEKSYTGYPYSQFTQALLEALAGADLDTADGFVRVSDLALYAAKTVPLHTQNKQNPDLHFDRADNFVVAYYAGGEKQPKGLPAEAQRQEIPEEENGSDQPGATTIHATNTGSGAQAVGDNNKVAGERGVVADTIGGDVMTGEHARKINTHSYVERQDVRNNTAFNQSGQTVRGNQTNFAGDIRTGGGTLNTGNINTGGGDFIGRDRRVYGDEVHGDKIGGDKVGGDKTTVGNIGSGAQVAIGRGITQTRGAKHDDFSAAERNHLYDLVVNLYVQLAQLENLPQQEQILAKDRIEQIEETLKAEDEPAEWRTLQRAGDWLLQHVPAMADSLRTLFIHPIVAQIAEGAGDAAVAWLQNRFGWQR